MRDCWCSGVVELVHMALLVLCCCCLLVHVGCGAVGACDTSGAVMLLVHACETAGAVQLVLLVQLGLMLQSVHVGTDGAVVLLVHVRLLVLLCKWDCWCCGACGTSCALGLLFVH